jgi:hypothetical protein
MKAKIAALLGFVADNIKESLKLRMIFSPFHDQIDHSSLYVSMAYVKWKVQWYNYQPYQMNLQ